VQERRTNEGVERLRGVPRIALLGLWLLALAGGCSASAGAEPAPTVILISMDGTRPADVTKETMPSLVGLGERGVVAERLVPVFPSNTFPNHVSLATGVAPERHGMVNNIFVDPERGVFDRRNLHTWIEVEPIWSVLEGQGITTASYFWVGSEGPWPGGHAPTHWKPFLKATPEGDKVVQMLEWLDLPEGSGRPHFIASWFRGADSLGHKTGPGTDRVRRFLGGQDAALASLIRGLEQRGLFATTTLIVVSDHGMVTAEREVDLGTALEQAGVRSRVFGIGGFATVVLDDGSASPARAVEVARTLGLEAYARERAPASWRVGHPRFGNVVVRAPVGTAVVHPRLRIAGFHGYDPEHESMSAIFYAAGRGVSPGTRLPAVHNLDVAPTVLALLGLEVPGWMERRPISALVPSGRASATLTSPAAEQPGPKPQPWRPLGGPSPGTTSERTERP
jgi:predicted AlkP superfamily pyrophosphatase or phosphodiesterase